MAWEMKEGSGSLFKNSKKTADNHPDYQGSVMIGGNIYQLGAWKKQTKTGDIYLSISAKIKAPGNAQVSAPQATASNANQQKPERKEYPKGESMDNFDDDLPF